MNPPFRKISHMHLHSLSIDSEPGPYGGRLTLKENDMTTAEQIDLTDIPYLEKAKMLVAQHANERMNFTEQPLKVEDVYVVWFCKTLQNWKAMLSSTRPDDMYYEVTYDGDNSISYVDSYKKWENKAYPDAPA